MGYNTPSIFLVIAALLKKTITYTATKFLANNSVKAKNNKLCKLSLCTALIRLCTATKPDINKINSFINTCNHNDMADLINIDMINDTVDYDGLINQLNYILKDALPLNIRDHDKVAQELSGFSDQVNSAELPPPPPYSRELRGVTTPPQP